MEVCMAVHGTRLRALVFGIGFAFAGGFAASAQGSFNNWSRCTDTRIPPERRIGYCGRLLNSGGGPNSEITVLTALGSIYRDMHRYSEAIDAYTRALSYEALGVSDSHQETEAPGSAISIPTSGALIGALEGRAEVYALSGKHDLALADSDHIFRLAPQAANSYAVRCRIRAMLKSELDKALGDCSAAVKLEPRNTQVLGASGLLQYQLGHLKDAADDFDQTLKISPKLAGALYMRGLVELHSGNSAAGNADIAAAKDQNPNIAKSFADFGVTP
jgi:tetratricopeptide (TPR) repeat protein